jgi:hypothetical protein
MLACVQLRLVASQVSRVQGSSSAQSVSKAQHPAIFSLEHRPVPASHRSRVQGFVSAQSASLWQQPGTASCLQTFWEQESLVQLLPSSHCAAL